MISTGKISLIFLLFLSTFFSEKAFSITASVKPNYIPIDCFFYGGKVCITGYAKKDEEIIIKITSKEKVNFLRKKKKINVLWVNSYELEFHFSPDVYLLYSTKKISNLLNEKEKTKYCIGYPALKKHIKIHIIKNNDTIDCNNKCECCNEYFRLQEARNIYGVFNNSIKTKIIGNEKYFELILDWHYEAPPTNYKINIYGIKNKTIQNHLVLTLKSEKIGFLKQITEIANNNSLIYSVFSIIIVIVFSFFVSIIFNTNKCKR
ncbi:MAG: hypothetical protein GXO79_12935 [Chlorobi bacterium]|nr:hypothetical protein [Chlorobiota bacterium]